MISIESYFECITKDSYLKNQIINNIYLFEFPNKLKELFDFLNKSKAKPIIVGGSVRDKLLGLKNIKDLDVEVYNISSYKKLTEILKQFARVNFVGESFGVCKIQIDDIECDFSLPRVENKISKGHKGFEVIIDTSIDFKEASKRRDFTINAIGYDVINNTLLDPHKGLFDLKNKLLRYVNKDTFKDDPLRILRCVGFASRLEFQIDKELFFTCKKMIKQNLLKELPKERIYQEFVKIFLKSKKPSIAIEILKKMEENYLLEQLFTLEKPRYQHTLETLDNLAKTSQKELIFYFLALSLHVKNQENFLKNFTNEKRMFLGVKKFSIAYQKALNLLKNGYDDFEVKLLAKEIEIKKILIFLEASQPKYLNSLQQLKQKAIELNVYTKPLKQIINGDDLISLGFKPSKAFKKILEDIYIYQLKNSITDKKTLLKIIKENYVKS